MNIQAYGSNVVLTAIHQTAYRDNNAPAVMLVLDWPSGERDMLPLSVNLVDAQLDSARLNEKHEGAFYAKNYSEGEPFYNALRDEGLIEEIGVYADNGYVRMPAVRLTDKGKAMVKEPSETE